MNRYEAPAIMAREFPGAGSELVFLSITGNINKAMKLLAKYTGSLIESGKYNTVNKCMAVVDSMYEKGDLLVKNAIANEFVYYFSLMSLSCNKVEWHIVQAKIPFRLYSIYIKQSMQSAC